MCKCVGDIVDGSAEANEPDAISVNQAPAVEPLNRPFIRGHLNGRFLWIVALVISVILVRTVHLKYKETSARKSPGGCGRIRDAVHREYTRVKAVRLDHQRVSIPRYIIRRPKKPSREFVAVRSIPNSFLNL